MDGWKNWNQKSSSSVRIPGIVVQKQKKSGVVRCASVIPLLSHQLSADPVDTLARELKVSIVGKATHLDHGFSRLAVGLRTA